MNKGIRMLVIPDVLFSWRKLEKEDNRGSMNLSKNSINNIRSRGNIIKILSEKKNLHPKIRRIVFNKRFEKRFLLDSIIFDKSINKQEVVSLFQHDREIVDAINKLNRNFLTRFEIRTTHLKSYLSIFGFAGFLYVLWFACQWGCNKINLKKIL
jgi:hypothetical protein